MKRFSIILCILVSFAEIVNGGDLGSKMATLSDNECLSIQSEDISIEYNSYLASTGWIALYDTKRSERCYMSKSDYNAIRENRRFIKGYEYLIPLGIVLKYNGAKIIWGFEGVKSVNWNDAKEYAENYSPDGYEWRLLSKIEASAIKTKAYDFTEHFIEYYPQDISYLGAFRTIKNWTSALSNETYKEYNLVYTLVIHGSDAKIEKRFSVYEDDVYNVYPISDL